MQMNAWDKVYFFENHVKNIYAGILHFHESLIMAWSVFAI
jgi:hypothetical protein